VTVPQREGDMTEQAVALRQRATIARAAGAVATALGFVFGMRGLDEPASVWLQTAEGLIVTGLIAQGYALWCTARWQRLRAACYGERTGGHK
jgi:flagellar motor component MotA